MPSLPKALRRDAKLDGRHKFKYVSEEVDHHSAQTQRNSADTVDELKALNPTSIEAESIAFETFEKQIREDFQRRIEQYKLLVAAGCKIEIDIEP